MLPHQMRGKRSTPISESELMVAYDSSSFMNTRCDIGKAPSPTLSLTQSVKTTELATSRGFDAHKKVKGRKRHIVTDTIGIPLGVKLMPMSVITKSLLHFSWHITIQLMLAIVEN